MEETDTAEIRLLGSLRVRRADGTVVSQGEWRTGKTVDLLRILALEVDRPVRVDTLLENLWPDVDEARGRASLRTAASQIRRTLRTDCIERRMGGLVLTRAWVDVVAFRRAATNARASQRQGDHARVVRFVREAEALYLADFEAHDGGSTWAFEVRESLATMRRDVLADAAESAVEVAWMRDAIDLAERAIDADPFSERAHRALMRALAGLGESDRALKVFASFRRTLEEELGMSPSRQTTAVQMSVLSGDAGPAPASSFVAREKEAAALAEDLVEAAATAGVEVACVVGARGSGREALVAEALRRADLPVVHARPRGSHELLTASDIARSVPVHGPGVVVLPADAARDVDPVAALVTTLARTEAGTTAVVIPVEPDVHATLVAALEAGSVPVRSLETGPLARDELEDLAESVLLGPVTIDLVDQLAELSDGLAGTAVAVLRSWVSSGRVISTATGLDVTDTVLDAAADCDLGALRPALERLTPLAMDVTQLVALLDRPVTATLVRSLLDTTLWSDVTVDEVGEVLDLLTDQGVMAAGDHGYAFRHPLMRDATQVWLRPATRRRLHQRIAEADVLPECERAEHWMLAVMPLRACRAAISAAGTAVQRGDRARAGTLLSRALHHAAGLDSTPAEHVGALRELAEAARDLGFAGPAGAADAAASAVARDRGVAIPQPRRPEPVPSLDAETPTPVGPSWMPQLTDAIRRLVDSVAPGQGVHVILVAPGVAAADIGGLSLPGAVAGLDTVRLPA